MDYVKSVDGESIFLDYFEAMRLWTASRARAAWPTSRAWTVLTMWYAQAGEEGTYSSNEKNVNSMEVRSSMWKTCEAATQ